MAIKKSKPISAGRRDILLHPLRLQLKTWKSLLVVQKKQEEMCRVK